MSDDNAIGEGISTDANLVVGARTTKAYHFVYYVLTVLEILFAFRFFLKLLAASPNNVFAEVVYGITYVFLLPFASLFPPAVTTDGKMPSAFEPSTLVAMVFYAILAWAVAKYIVISRSRSDKAKKR